MKQGHARTVPFALVIAIPLEHDTMSLGFTSAAVWIAFELPSEGPGRLVASVRCAYLDWIELYEGTRFVGRDSRLIARSSRAYPWRYRSIAIPQAETMDPKAALSPPRRFYLKAWSEDTLFVPFSVMTEEELWALRAGENLFYGLWFGFSAFSFAWVLASWLAVRERGYLHLAAFIASYAGWWFFLSGLAMETFLGEYPYTARIALVAPMSAFIIFRFVFMKSFVETRRNFPKINLFLDACIGIYAIYAIVAFSIPFRTASSFVNYLAVFLTIPAFLMMIHVYRKGFKSVRIIVLAVACFQACMQAWELRQTGFVPGIAWLDYLPLLGSASETGFFLLALSRKVGDMKREKEEAQAILIEEQRKAIEERTRRADSFARFVPRDFLSILGRSDIVEIELGDQASREMTVLFSDIRSFASLSEGMSPEENFPFVNEYFAAIVPAVEAHGGFVDKYIGDAVMALFDGPALSAAQAAAAMRVALREFNAELAAWGAGPIDAGIGLHRGSLMLGTEGQASRMETTVIADAVNLASRLEGLTKAFAAPR